MNTIICRWVGKAKAGSWGYANGTMETRGTKSSENGERMHVYPPLSSFWPGSTRKLSSRAHGTMASKEGKGKGGGARARSVCVKGRQRHACMYARVWGRQVLSLFSCQNGRRTGTFVECEENVSQKIVA